MASINLDSNREGRAPQAVSFGVIVILLVFLLTAVAYVAVLFYNKKLDSDISSTKAEYDKNYQVLISGNTKNVVSFQNRLDIAKKLIDRGVNNREVFSEIEKLMIPNVYLDSFKYDEKTGTISLECLADNYNSMAKQILSFKSGTYFSGFSGGESKLDVTQNKVSFAVNMRIK